MLKSQYSNIHRLYNNSTVIKENENLILESNNFHFIKNVLRLKKGNYLKIFNELDGEFLAEITSFEKNFLSLNICQALRVAAKQNTLMLALSIIKADKMAEAINMATQLGVTEIIPIVAQRSQTKIINTERLSKIMIEAAEQSNRITVPILNKPISLENSIEILGQGQIIFADENENSSSSINNLILDKEYISLIVGPEGGFTESEILLMSSWNNSHSISLGVNILRTETAAAAGLAQIQARKLCLI